MDEAGKSQKACWLVIGSHYFEIKINTLQFVT